MMGRLGKRKSKRAISDEKAYYLCDEPLARGAAILAARRAGRPRPVGRVAAARRCPYNTPSGIR